MDEISLLQVGAGAWGESWARTIVETPGVSLAGIIDMSRDAAVRVARSVGLPEDRVYATLAEGAEGAHADGVVIVSPPHTHAALALEAFDHGLHCLIEKPLAESIEDARRIVQAADTAGVRAMVSQNYRFKRAPRTVQRLIQAGTIGTVESVRIDYRKNPPFTGFRAEMHEPLLIDMSIHHLDQLRGIVGIEPATLRARSWNPSWSGLQGNSSALVEMVGEKGEQIIYTGSWSSHGGTTTWDGSWDIEGTRGGITWAQNRVTVRFASVFDTVFMPGAVERDGVMEVDLDLVEFEERAGTLREFRRAVLGDEQPETSAVDNLRSVALVLAAVDSADNGGRTVDLTEVRGDDDVNRAEQRNKE